MNEFDELMKAFGEAGADKRIFENKDIAHLAVRVDCKWHG